MCNNILQNIHKYTYYNMNAENVIFSFIKNVIFYILFYANMFMKYRLLQSFYIK